MRPLYVLLYLDSCLAAQGYMGLPSFSAAELQRRFEEYTSLPQNEPYGLSFPGNPTPFDGIGSGITAPKIPRGLRKRNELHERPSTPGKMPVTFDGYGFYVPVRIGERKEPLTLVLDTASGFTFVRRVFDCPIRNYPSTSCRSCGKYGYEITNTTKTVDGASHWLGFSTDGSNAWGQFTMIGEITSLDENTTSAGPLAKWWSYIPLADRTRGFGYPDRADGALGFSKSTTAYPIYIEPVDNPFGWMFGEIVPWASRSGLANIEFFSTYLNRRKPEKAYLGMDYFDGDDIANFSPPQKTTDSPYWEILTDQNWRFDLYSYAHQEDTYTLDSSQHYIPNGTRILMDTKSQYMFLGQEIALKINTMLGGNCSHWANGLDREDIGSNYKFSRQICAIPCQWKYGETGYHQNSTIGISIPWHNASIWLAADTPFTLQPLTGLQPYPRGTVCRPEKTSPCIDYCVSRFQQIEGNGPNKDVKHNANETSSLQWVYGIPVFTNAFFKWDTVNGTISMAKYK
ncbi:hypothetical protein ABW19_dt0205776 [Dactylella cylindrospora]|nr:hypothetical protein ABW19_dt0205776 [Dactylella cylindrospora]